MAEGQKVSSGVLGTLSRCLELQGLLDICSTQSKRNEVSRGINYLPTSLITSSMADLLTSFGDVCSAPLSGMDPEGSLETFAGEEDWKRLLHYTASRRLRTLQAELISIPPTEKLESEKMNGSFNSEPKSETDFL